MLHFLANVRRSYTKAERETPSNFAVRRWFFDLTRSAGERTVHSHDVCSVTSGFAREIG